MAKVTSKKQPVKPEIGHRSIKQQIRDTERLLKRVQSFFDHHQNPTAYTCQQDNLNASVRQDAERKLNALKLQNETNHLHLKEKQHQEKYKMVKFFGTLSSPRCSSTTVVVSYKSLQKRKRQTARSNRQKQNSPIQSQRQTEKQCKIYWKNCTKISCTLK